MLQPDDETLHRALQEMAEAIRNMSKALKRMHGNSIIEWRAACVPQ